MVGDRLLAAIRIFSPATYTSFLLKTSIRLSNGSVLFSEFMTTPGFRRGMIERNRAIAQDSKRFPYFYLLIASNTLSRVLAWTVRKEVGGNENAITFASRRSTGCHRNYVAGFEPQFPCPRRRSCSNTSDDSDDNQRNERRSDSPRDCGPTYRNRIHRCSSKIDNHCGTVVLSVREISNVRIAWRSCPTRPSAPRSGRSTVRWVVASRMRDCR
jgi:hypothetical protein